MSNTQKLTDMVEFYRGKLNEETLRLSDAVSTIMELKRQVEALQSELEGSNVQEKDSGEDLRYSPE